MFGIFAILPYTQGNNEHPNFYVYFHGPIFQGGRCGIIRDYEETARENNVILSYISKFLKIVAINAYGKDVNKFYVEDSCLDIIYHDFWRDATHESEKIHVFGFPHPASILYKSRFMKNIESHVIQNGQIEYLSFLINRELNSSVDQLFAIDRDLFLLTLKSSLKDSKFDWFSIGAKKPEISHRIVQNMYENDSWTQRIDPSSFKKEPYESMIKTSEEFKVLQHGFFGLNHGIIDKSIKVKFS